MPSICKRSIGMSPLCTAYSRHHHTRLGRPFQALERTATLLLISLAPTSFTALPSAPFHCHYCDKAPLFFPFFILYNLAFAYNLLHTRSRRILGISLKHNTRQNPGRGVTCWVRVLMRTSAVLACVPSEADHQGLGPRCHSSELPCREQA